MINLTDLLPKNQLSMKQYLLSCYAGYTPTELITKTPRWFTENKETIMVKGLTSPCLPKQIERLAKCDIDANSESNTYEDAKFAIVEILIKTEQDERFIEGHTKVLEHNRSRFQREKKPVEDAPPIETHDVVIPPIEVKQVLAPPIVAEPIKVEPSPKVIESVSALKARIGYDFEDFDIDMSLLKKPRTNTDIDTSDIEIDVTSDYAQRLRSFAGRRFS